MFHEAYCGFIVYGDSVFSRDLRGWEFETTTTTTTSTSAPAWGRGRGGVRAEATEALGGAGGVLAPAVDEGHARGKRQDYIEHATGDEARRACADWYWLSKGAAAPVVPLPPRKPNSSW
jgi:hypothetical protein